MSEQETMTIHTEMYPPDSSDVTLRQIGLGIEPILLIEPTEEENGDAGFAMTLSLLDYDDAKIVLQTMLDALENA